MLGNSQIKAVCRELLAWNRALIGVADALFLFKNLIIFKFIAKYFFVNYKNKT